MNYKSILYGMEQKYDSERWVGRDVEVVVACLRNSLPTGRLKQDGTCTKYYFQRLLKTEEYYHFIQEFIIFVWVCNIFCEMCDLYGIT